MKLKLFVFILLTIALVDGNLLIAQDINGAYSGKIRCSGKDFTVHLFVYKAEHNIQYIRYKELKIKRKGAEVLTDIYAQSKLNRNLGYQKPKVTEVKKQNKDNLYLPHKLAFGYLPEESAIKLKFGYLCSNLILKKDNSLNESYKEFLAEMQPSVAENKWQTGSYGWKYRLDKDNSRIYLIDGKEWTHFGTNYDATVSLYIPYPINCENIIEMIGVAHRINIFYGYDEDIMKAVSAGNFKNFNIFQKCPNNKAVKFKIYNSKQVNSTTFYEGYSTPPYGKFIKGKMPDLDKNAFTCGKLNSMFEKSGNKIKVIVKAPNESYVQENPSELACLVEKNLEVLKNNQSFTSNNQVLEIITKVDTKIIQKNELHRWYHWAFTPKLDSARTTVPLVERINLLDYRISNGLYFEYIHYGLFEEARKLYAYDIFPASYVLYLIYFSRNYPDFLSNDYVEVPVKYTRTLENRIGVKRVLDEESYKFNIEPRYVEYFNQNLNSLVSITSWDKLLTAFGQKGINIQSDIVGLVKTYHPESKIVERFKENLYRYAYNKPPVQHLERNKKNLVLEGKLVKSEVIPLSDFFYERKLRQTADQIKNYRVYLRESKIERDVEVLKCTYKNNQEDKYIRYFWYKKEPANLEEKLRSVNGGNPLLNDIGPALIDAPKNLKDAIKLITENYK